MYGRCESGENGGYTELVVGKIFEKICVKGQNAKFMGPHSPTKYLHDEDLVV